MTNGITLKYILTAIPCLIVSLVIHEYMHGYVGYLLGDSTAKDQGRLSFNPLAHIDPFMTVLLPTITLIVFHAPLLAAKPVPFNPDRVKYDDFGAAMLAAAGPLSNIVLAIIAALIYKHFNLSSNLLYVLGVFITINIWLFVFNLIPIPPLDGSRILYAFAPDFLRSFMRDIEPYGIIIIFSCLILISGFSNFLSNINQSVLNSLNNLP